MSVADNAADAIVCSFCIKPTTEVRTMVGGPGVYICDECVALCAELIKNKPPKPAHSPNPPQFSGWESRLSDDDLLAMLPKVTAAGSQVDRQLARCVTAARTRGITWTRIGAALGTTRQSAWERFSGEE